MAVDRVSTAPVLRHHTTLLVGLACYLLGYAFHSYAHIAMMMAQTPPATIVAGSLGWLFAVVALVGVARGHRLAPHAVALLGLLTAAGLIVVHVPPDWGPFSDPLRSGTMPLVWYSFAAGLAGSLIAAATALRVLAEGRGQRP